MDKMKDINGFKVGDWLFYEFRLSKVLEIKDNMIVSVTNGYTKSFYNRISNEVFPLDEMILLISGEVKYMEDKLHRCKKHNLNYPDLDRELNRRWIEMCKIKDDKKEIERLFSSLNSFTKNVLNGKNKKFIF